MSFKVPRALFASIVRVASSRER